MRMPPCPQCAEEWTKRTHRRLWERLLSLAAIYPFQCQCCGHRFRVRQPGVRYVRSICLLP
jgi:hypothetical protein